MYIHKVVYTNGSVCLPKGVWLGEEIIFYKLRSDIDGFAYDEVYK